MRYKYLERKKCTSKWEEAGRETRCSDVAVRDEESFCTPWNIKQVIVTQLGRRLRPLTIALGLLGRAKGQKSVAHSTEAGD